MLLASSLWILQAQVSPPVKASFCASCFCIQFNFGDNICLNKSIKKPGMIFWATFGLQPLLTLAAGGVQNSGGHGRDSTARASAAEEGRRDGACAAAAMGVAG